jgi:hypothetical protein
MALRKVKAKTTVSISPISSTAAARQAERVVDSALRRLDADPTDDMTEAEAFEQLSKDRAAFMAQYGEILTNA